MFSFFSCSKISEVASNPPDEEKKAINSFYDATSYNLNGDYFDSQVIIQNLISIESREEGNTRRAVIFGSMEPIYFCGKFQTR